MVNKKIEKSYEKSILEVENLKQKFEDAQATKDKYQAAMNAELIQDLEDKLATKDLKVVADFIAHVTPDLLEQLVSSEAQTSNLGGELNEY